jgi:hypothetical protein
MLAECRYAECRYAECRYAECRYAECHFDRVIMLSVIVFFQLTSGHIACQWPLL